VMGEGGLSRMKCLKSSMSGGSWGKEMCVVCRGVEVRGIKEAYHWSCSGDVHIQGREAVHAAECQRLEISNGCARELRAGW